MTAAMQREDRSVESLRSARRVAVIGAGGLGNPVAVALAEAGVALRLVDDDRVELSNLPRQVLFTTADLGRPKLEAARDALVQRFGAVVECVTGRLDATNRDALIGEVDLAIDATDDPAARFLVNDWGLAKGRPVVIGGVHRFLGMVFAHAGHGPCFRCLFEEEGPEVETCAAGGVLGPMAGWVGHLMAERALALLNGDRDTGYLTTLDGLRRRARKVRLPDGCDHAPVSIPRKPMAAIHIKIPASLRKFVANLDTVDVESEDVRGALDALEARHPGVKSKLCDDSGNVRRFINIYANSEDIRFLDNLETRLVDGAELQIVPAIAGGWY